MFDAPSISITSIEELFAISRQLEHFPQGVTVGPSLQLRALARIRAVEVLPHPRGPVNKYA